MPGLFDDLIPAKTAAAPAAVRAPTGGGMFDDLVPAPSPLPAPQDMAMTEIGPIDDSQAPSTLSDYFRNVPARLSQVLGKAGELAIATGEGLGFEYEDATSADVANMNARLNTPGMTPADLWSVLTGNQKAVAQALQLPAKQSPIRTTDTLETIKGDLAGVFGGASPIAGMAALLPGGMGLPIAAAEVARGAVDPNDLQGSAERIGRIGRFSGQTIGQSIPDMLAATNPVTLPGYIAGRTEEIADERAANDGRDDAGLKDRVIGALAAVPESLLERATTKRLFPGGTPAGGGTPADALLRVLQEGGIQAGGEVVEELAPYLASTLGTEAGPTAQGAGDTALAALLAGGPMGAGAQGGKEVLAALSGSPAAPAAAPTDPLAQAKAEFDAEMLADPDPAKWAERAQAAAARHGITPEDILQTTDGAQAPPAPPAPPPAGATNAPQGAPTDALDALLLRNVLPPDAPPAAPQAAPAPVPAPPARMARPLPPQEAPSAPPADAPVTMQNRDRSRAASVSQMQNIRKSPDPARLGFSRDANTGAPMVGEGRAIPDADKGRADTVVMASGRRVPVRYAVVEAADLAASNDADGRANPNYEAAPLKALNNGRVAGLQAAWQDGNGEAYRQGIAADAALHGVPAAAIAGKRNPVLVRLYDPATNAGDMGAESNASAQLGLSPVEQAQTDARALPNLDGLTWNADGTLSPTANADFFRGWFRRMGDTQAATLQDAQGRPNAAALQRVRGAMVQRAYGDERLLTAISEEVNPENRNAMNALVQAAPGFATLEEGHALTAELRGTLAGAMDLLRDASARGLSLRDALAQGDILGRNPAADAVAQFMADNARSANRMAEAFKAMAAYADARQRQAAANDIFGTAESPTITAALEAANAAIQPDTAPIVVPPGREGAAGARGRGGEREAGQGSASRVESQLDLIPEPTPREAVDAQRRQRDDARDGRTGTGRTDMAAGAGDLFAGRRPDQARIEPAETIDEILNDRGIPIQDMIDAERRWNDGERLFGFHEQAEGEAIEIDSLTALRNFAPDQLMALPRNDGRVKQSADDLAIEPRFVKRGRQEYLADERGEPIDYRTEGAAREAAKRVGGRILVDDAIEGQRPTWSVVRPPVGSIEADTSALSADQTQTPAFRRWFGDSEVTDSDGRPMVVYHGSPASFDAFDPDEHTAGWFSEAPATADRYADNPNRFDPEAEDGPQVYPVFLSIQRPAHLPFDMNDSREAVWDTAREIGIVNPEKLWPKPMPGVHKAAWSAVRSDEFIDALVARGFDGIRVREKGVQTWAAFRSEQIKSATANSGAFDASNPSMLRQDTSALSTEATESAPFKRWAQGAPVIRLDDFVDYEGGPAVFELLHGTTGNFDVFDVTRANPESDLGAGFYFTNTEEDAGNNYAGLGPDLTNKIELLAERMASERDKDYDDPEIKAEARAQFMANDGSTMKVYVRALSPAIIGGDNETHLEIDYNYDEETEEYGEESGTLVDFIEHLRDVASDYHDGDVDGGIRRLLDSGNESIPLSQLISTLKESEEFGYFTDDDGRLVSTEIIREALERTGFDAIVDYTVDEKFGSQNRRINPMAGMHPGTAHVVAFDPKQIKSATGNRGTFDPSDPSVVNASRDLFVPTRGQRDADGETEGRGQRDDSSAPVPERQVEIPFGKRPPDTRPDWTPALARKGKYAIDRLVQRFGGTVVSDTLGRDFQETHVAMLVGQRVTGAKQLAAIAEIYRNPIFETLRYVFHDADGNVLGETAVSTRQAASATAYPDGVDSNVAGMIWINKVAPKGATGFWMIHNHPSGDPKASQPDIRFTTALAETIDLHRNALKLSGHVILNHTKFGYIDEGGFNKGVFDIEREGPDPLRQKRGIDFVGKDAAGANWTANYGRQVFGLTPANSFAAITLGARGEVITAATYPADKFKSMRGMAALSTVAERSGGVGIVIVADASVLSQHKRQIQEATKRRLLFDIVEVGPDGSVRSDSRRGGIVSRTLGQQSRRRIERDGVRVYEGEEGLSVEAPQLTPIQRDAMEKAGLNVDTRSTVGRAAGKLREEWQKIREAATDTDALKQAAFDRFHGLRAAEARMGGVSPEVSPYLAARLSTGLPSIMESINLFGAPQWRDGVLSIDPNTKGLLDVLEPVKADLDAWLGWMVGRRAALLKSQGRENLFSDADIDALLSLARGKEAAFKEAATGYLKVKNAVLDVAEQAGLIDPAQRAAWDHAEYLPFYRQEGDRALGPGTRRGLAGQTSGIRALKGGEARLADPMGNIMRNFTTLIDASMKNRSMLLAVDTFGGSMFEKLGPEFSSALIPMDQVKKRLIDDGVPQSVIDGMPNGALKGVQKMFSLVPPTGEDVVRVMRDGKAEYYRVDDPLVLRALTAFKEPIKNWAIKPFIFAKRLLTVGVTATAEFVGANLLRDTASTWIIGNERVRLGIDAANGIVRTLLKDKPTQDMMAAGGSFIGGNFYGGDQDATAAALRRSLRARGLKDRDIEGFMGTVARSPLMLWDKWMTISSAIENANRHAIYQAAIKEGKPRAQAIFEAKDLMDFSMQGDSAFMQFFADVLPFFNARVQGLYKLGRAGADPQNRRRMIGRGSVLALASTGLWAWNTAMYGAAYDDLEEWDKDTYWHIAPGTPYHTRIPKPFEVGLLFGTAPERMAQALVGNDRGEQSWESLMRAIGGTLAMNPVPQGALPVVEQWANRRFFTGRPIENIGDDKLLPEAREEWYSSDTMKFIADAVGNDTGLSAKRLEHLWNGYTGGFGGYVLESADWLVRQGLDAPERPEMAISETPVFGRFLRGDSVQRNTRYVSEFYDLREEAGQISGTIKEYLEAGKTAKAERLEREHAWLLGERVASKQAKAGIMFSNVRAMEKLVRKLGDVRRDTEAKMASDATPTEKREALNAMTAERNAEVKKLVRQLREAQRQPRG